MYPDSVEDWKMHPRELWRSQVDRLNRLILSRYPGVETVFLFGSHVVETHTTSSDLDVGVILNSPPPIDSRLPPFVLSGVPVEIHAYHRAQLDDVKTTAANPWLGSQLIHSRPIYDPANVFTTFKDRFAEVYNARSFIHRRVDNALTAARAYIRNAEHHLTRGQPALAPGSLHQAAVSGIAMALFHRNRANPTQRRCLSSLEASLTTAAEHDVYNGLLRLMALDDADDDRAAEAITLGEKVHVDLTEYLRSLTSDLFQRTRQFYCASTRERIIDGARMLRRAGNYPAAIFCSMMLVNASEICAHLLPHVNPATREELNASLTQLFPFNVERGIETAKALVKQVRDLG